jgi:hypothetical protein
MRTQDIKVGEQYEMRVSGRTAVVTVKRVYRDLHGTWRVEAETHDTRRRVRGTCRRLSPSRGTPAALAEASRLAVATAKREARRDVVPLALPEPTGFYAARPVPGMLSRVGNGPCAALSHRDESPIIDAVGRVHVAEPYLMAVKQVVARLRYLGPWRRYSREVRRGILMVVAERHRRNRETYREVMGHDPLPSESMVARAIVSRVGVWQ